MSSGNDTRLRQSLTELATVLRGAPPDARQSQELADLIEENELQDDAAAPSWLLDLLAAITNRRLTGHWVDFRRSSGDDTNVLDFIRQLNQVLPIEYENNEESWLLAFPTIDLEAGISLEGSCYKVSKLGRTWDEQ